ncbi:MAG TPA: GNAT family N-acetyltransferase, partial [Thermomicrobiales bacterium]|nr:GNAT family N-acetyltransferase [Thermomicrobiales bacterium]
MEPRPLWPADVPRLWLDHHPRLDSADAAALLVQAPGASWWIPDTGEFLLVTPWRRRPHLVTVHTFGAFANERALMDAVATQAESDGRAGIVLVDVNEVRQQEFYDRNGFERYEDLVTYSHRDLGRLAKLPAAPGLSFRAVDGTDPALMRSIEMLDHGAFPWFWWNSAAEFAAYLVDPVVELWAGFLNGEMVAYTGLTMYRRWGHLDRIAVAPALQGRGLGRAALAFSARRLAEQGAKMIALSTQGQNERSRALYDGTGFRRTPRDDYAVHVRVI